MCVWVRVASSNSNPRKPFYSHTRPPQSHIFSQIQLEPNQCYALLGTESAFPSEAVHRFAYSEAHGCVRPSALCSSFFDIYVGCIEGFWGWLPGCIGDGYVQ